jgi:hypothetical protein
MKLFGFEITRVQKTLSGVDSRGGMSSWFRVLESFSGAWQTNTEVELTNVLTYAPVYACVRLISSDIGKLRLRLVRQDKDGLWHETENPAFSPVLRKPNRYQTRIKFIQYWLTSKLIHGNAYVLKQRDNRGVVTAMYVLDPTRVTPLVSEDGAVFYQLHADNLSGIKSSRCRRAKSCTTCMCSSITHWWGSRRFLRQAWLPWKRCGSKKARRSSSVITLSPAVSSRLLATSRKRRRSASRTSGTRISPAPTPARSRCSATA